MVLKSVTISNPFFHTEIIKKNQKWKQMGIGCPSLVFNKVSNNSRVFTSRISFFLLLHFQKQYVKLLNMLWNNLNLESIQLKNSLYQSKTEIMARNFQNISLLSFLESKNIKIDKKSSTNNISNVIEFLKSKSEVPDTARIFKESSFLKLLNPERYLSYVLELRISKFESSIKNTIERTGNIIKNLTLSDALSILQNQSNPKVTVHLENWKLLKEGDFLKESILLNREGFIRKIDSLRFLEPSDGIRSLKKSYFLNYQSYFLNYQSYFLNYISSLNSRIFSNEIKYLSILSSSNSVRQFLSTIFSKASSLIYSQKFTERQTRIDFPAKNVTELKVIQNEHYSAQEFKMLKVNKIKNPVLMFTLELSESLPDRIFSEFPKSIKLVKKSGFLKDYILLSKILLSKRGLLKNITALKILSSSTIKSNFHSMYSSDYNINLSNIVFSTGFYHSGNLNFSNAVQHLFYTSLSKASSHKYLQNFMEKPLRVAFPAKKVTELKVKGNEPYFAQKFNMLKVQGLNIVHPAFENIMAFPFRHFNLSLGNLAFPQRITQSSMLISQVPEVVNKKSVISLPELERRNKTSKPIFKKKELLPFALGNKIHGLERSKNLNFQKNGVNLIFRTQLEIEKKVEEEIEQRIGQKIEQLKKAATEVKEAISEQNRSDYSGIREHQKQYLDVNNISDQVFKLMERRLKIERERRGIL